MNGEFKKSARPIRRASVFVLAAVLACGLSFPSLAFATVKVDETELAQGENAVGGGTATLADTVLDMVDVTASTLYTDEDLTVNFNGGNDIGEIDVAGEANTELNFNGENEVGEINVTDEATAELNFNGENDINEVNVTDEATAELNFTGENEVEEVHASGSSDVTINADGQNEFEEIEATEQSNVTINVTGENEFEEIVGLDDADITIRGTDCQKKDVVKLGEDEEDTAITTERGALIIDHVTVEIEAEEAVVGSTEGDVVIDTSKIEASDETEYTEIVAGGTMEVTESVIDIEGTVHSEGEMTIDHSDVKVEAPEGEYSDESPYRVWSKTGIELKREENGEVKEGKIGDDDVYYVDTDDGDDVDLEADGDPAYYKCKDEGVNAAPLPKTGDGSNPMGLAIAAVACAAIALFSAKRHKEERGL